VRMTLDNRPRGPAITVSMLRALALSVLIAATPMPAPVGAADGYDSGRVG
jgi:hypothetical protein